MNNMFMDVERSDFLEHKVRASSKKGLLSAWPRTEKELPWVELEVDWIRFSTENHRTQAEQRREIHSSGQLNLFTNDPLGPVAQEAQYKILCKQAGFEDLKTDLGERGQQEQAVVTAEGILINGNRRAAALRSLLHDKNDLSCRYIRCLVLPSDATPPEMLQLETELQVAKDFKQNYSWVNEAILIEELYAKHGRDFKQVAMLMHRQEKDIRENYEKIQQVNQLVALSNSKWLHVDFEPNESAFDELAKHIRNKNEIEKKSVRSVYFLGTLAGVNYRDLRNLRRADAQELVEKELQGDKQLEEFLSVAKSNGSADKPQSDLLDDVLGEENETALVHSVLELVAGLDRNEALELPSGSKLEVDDVYNQLSRTITKAAEEAAEQQKDVSAVEAPIIRLEKALSELSRAHSALPEARAVPSWNEDLYTAKLKAVDECIAKLKG